MRRRVILVGSAALLAALIAGVIMLVVLRPEEDDPAPKVEPGPTFLPYELTPQEIAVVATPEPGGTLAVEQTLIFDAGPGLHRPVTLWLGGTQLGWKTSPRGVQYGVVPVATNLEAREIGGSGLTVRVTEQPHRNPLSSGRRYELVPSAPWSPGRHAVVINYRLGDVWVQAEGANALVLPLSFAGGPGGSQPADLVRIRIAGVTQLECAATNIDFGARAECGSRGLFAYHDREYSSVSALVVTDPPGVKAQPIPITERET